MNNVKCLECNFVNFLDAVVCKRCGNGLNGQADSTSHDKSAKSLSRAGLTENVIDYTEENRRFGAVALVAGAASSIAPWILTFYLGIVSGKLNGLLVVFGLSFVVAGLVILIDPPKTKLDAEENKPRNGILILIGLMLGVVETFLFNRALGVW